jgi:hypothetical protein
VPVPAAEATGASSAQWSAAACAHRVETRLNAFAGLGLHMPEMPSSWAPLLASQTIGQTGRWCFTLRVTGAAPPSAGLCFGLTTAESLRPRPRPAPHSRGGGVTASPVRSSLLPVSPFPPADAKSAPKSDEELAADQLSVFAAGSLSVSDSDWNWVATGRV